MGLKVHIAVGGTVPLYRQIVDQVRLAVSTGTLVAGEQLPSVRTLAEQLVINPNTVAKAYTLLTQEGVVEAHAGKGLFVAQRRQRFSIEERERRLELALESFLNEVLFLDFSPEEILEQLKKRLDAMTTATTGEVPSTPLSKQDIK